VRVFEQGLDGVGNSLRSANGFDVAAIASQMGGGGLDTPTFSKRGILGSSKPLKLESLRHLAQRWDSPQA
jgi:hypothetical protein